MTNPNAETLHLPIPVVHLLRDLLLVTFLALVVGGFVAQVAGGPGALASQPVTRAPAAALHQG